MSYMEKLLEGVKVEWKPLADISELYNGLSGKTRTDFEDGNAQYISFKNVFDNVEIDFNRYDKVKVSSDENQNTLKYGDVIFTGSSETPAEAGMSSAVTSEPSEDVYLNSFSFGLRFNDDIEVIPEFSKYLFRSPSMRANISKSANGVTRYNISKKTFKKILIPIPPLEIQKEIVGILDSLTELIKELIKELDGRKKQYYYYLNQLLSFTEGEVEMKPLNDIGEFQRGKRFVKTDMISEGVPCIHYGEMYTHYDTWANETKSFVSKELVENKKLRVAEKGDVVIVAAGETIEDIGKGTAWLGDESVVTHDACFSYRSPLNPKFVAYFTRTKHFHDQIRRHVSSGKISAINAKGLGKVIIPVPSKEVQDRIVIILDKFDKLTISMSEGLPKEIKLRKKQYAYYRDVLLTFPKENLKA